MKKNLLHPPLLLFLLPGLFLATEIIWIIYLYHVEEKDFRVQINQALSSAIKEEIYAVKKENTDYYLDLTKKDTLVMAYTVKKKYFRIDTTRKAVIVLLNRMLYDFYKDSWNLDSMVQQFRHFSPWPQLPITFVRQDVNGKIIGQYPSGSKVPDSRPDIPPQQLGNIFTDPLSAWFNLPLTCFWERQKYGLLLSLLPLLLALYYGTLIIKKQRLEKRHNSLLEKQTVFIHDLKTPLCTNRDIEKRILKNESNWDSEKVNQKLEITSMQSGQLLSEMEKLTLLSASEWGGKIDNQTFNLKEALETLLAYRQAGNEEIQINLDFRLENPEVFADPFHLLHIIDNLVGNAVKHANKAIKIDITCSKDHQERLLISVKDNGPGIPAHLQKHIFKTGFRKKQNSDNHGLGLAYIKKIVHQYKGHIHISSKENEGTEFFLVFNPAALQKSKQLTISPYIYYYFFISLLIAGGIWLANLYAAERTAFLNQEGKLIEKAALSHSMDILKWHEDTTFFRNNWAEKTITIVRNQKDTTVPMGTSVHQSYVYGHMSYDLRDTCWCLDTIANIYPRVSSNSYPALFIRRDGTGQITDRFPADTPEFFMPVIFTMPLGFVEGHQLEVHLAYPWISPLINHRVWLIITLASILLTGWFSYLLVRLTLRQQQMIRFQRGKVQHFIRELHPQMEQILYSEKDMVCQTKNTPAGQISHCLQNNIRSYESILEKINYLLDQMVSLQIH